MQSQSSGPKISGVLLRAEVLRFDPVTVNFAACLELTGLVAILKESHLELRLRCRLLRGLHRPLLCFIGACGEVLIDDRSLPGDGRPDDVLLILMKTNIDQISEQLPAEVEFGFRDAQSNVPLPVCASSLPVSSDYTRVRARCNESPPVGLLYSFGWPVLKTSRGTVQDGVELVAYSLQCLNETAWVRLKWQIHSQPGRRLRFLGRIMAGSAKDDASVVNFEQDISLRPEASAQVAEQNFICRAANPPGASLILRGGVFDLRAGTWLRVLDFCLNFPEAATG